MRFDIMTLFPDLVERVLGESIIGRAQKSGACTVRVFNIRDYSEDRRHRVDDTPFGGGKGMLLAAKTMAATTLNLFIDSGLLQECQQEHQQVTDTQPYHCPIPKNVTPSPSK